MQQLSADFHIWEHLRYNDRPLYAGVEELAQEGQWVQWGGERLYTDGFTRMPGGRARFTAVPVPRLEIPPGKFHLTTRRGKQFHSMAQSGRDRVHIDPGDKGCAQGNGTCPQQ